MVIVSSMVHSRGEGEVTGMVVVSVSVIAGISGIAKMSHGISQRSSETVTLRIYNRT